MGAHILDDIMITGSGGEVKSAKPELKSLNSFAKLLEDAKPLDGYPFYGLGKRKYIQVKLKKHSIAFEFFAESFISPAPGNRGVGYEESDVTQQHGVIKYTITNDTDNINERQFSGDYIEFNDFLDEYISGDTARYSLECYMDSLIEASQLGDTFFANMNKLWNDRDINTPMIYKADKC